MTAYYLRLEVVRMLRSLPYLLLAVGAPIGFYLMFATLFGHDTPPGQLEGTVEIMVAMAAYGAIWAALSATGPRIAQERRGWLEQVRTTPMRAGQVLAAKVAASVILALPVLVLVCATAAAVEGVRLHPAQWVVLVAVMWVGTVPFAALGVAVGYAAQAESAYAICYGLYTAMSAIGGLWVPPAQLPDTLRSLASGLPTYRLADLGWHVVSGQAVPWTSAAILLAWTLGLSLAALALYRRPLLRRRAPRRRRQEAVA